MLVSELGFSSTENPKARITTADRIQFFSPPEIRGARSLRTRELASPFRSNFDVNWLRFELDSIARYSFAAKAAS